MSTYYVLSNRVTMLNKTEWNFTFPQGRGMIKQTGKQINEICGSRSCDAGAERLQS